MGTDRAETLDLSRRLVPDTIIADISVDNRTQNYNAVFLQTSEIKK